MVRVRVDHADDVEPFLLGREHRSVEFVRIKSEAHFGAVLAFRRKRDRMGAVEKLVAERREADDVLDAAGGEAADQQAAAFVRVGLFGPPGDDILDGTGNLDDGLDGGHFTHGQRGLGDRS